MYGKRVGSVPKKRIADQKSLAYIEPILAAQQEQAHEPDQNMADIAYEQIMHTQDIAQQLTSRHDGCDALKLDRRAGTLLGKGTYGKIYAVDRYGKKYAIKESNVTKDLSYVPICKAFPKLRVRDLKLTPHERYIFKQMQGLGDDDLVSACSRYAVPRDADMRCRLKDNTYFIRADGSGQEFQLPAGSYVCSPELVEFMVTRILSKLSNGLDRFFLNVRNYNACYDGQKKKYHKYFMMNRIDMSLSNLIKRSMKKPTNPKYMSVSMGDVNSILIQILFAIATLQETYEVMHNDLHPGNIFIQVLTPDEALHIPDKDGNMRPAIYHRYVLNSSVDGETEYYVPASRYRVKIGDFGLAVMYGNKPLIGNSRVLSEGLNSGVEMDANTIIPYTFCANWYTPVYDIMYCFEGISTSISYSHGGDYTDEERQRDKMGHMYRMAIKFLGEIIGAMNIGDYFVEKMHRPIINPDDITRVHEYYAQKNKELLKQLKRKYGKKKIVKTLKGEYPSKEYIQQVYANNEKLMPPMIPMASISSLCDSAVKFLLNSHTLDDKNIQARKRPHAGYIKTMCELAII